MSTPFGSRCCFILFCWGMVAQGSLVRMAVSVPTLKSLSYPLSQGALSHHLRFLLSQRVLSSARQLRLQDSCPFPLLSLLLWGLVPPMSWKSSGVTSMTLFPNLSNGKHKLSLWYANTGLLTSTLRHDLWLTSGSLYSKCHLCLYFSKPCPAFL